jgi:NAD dependent epimerase/dehydratase family enzyme
VRGSAGGPLGTGRQWMSWIHREDLVALIITALSSKSYKGVYNATAPKPVSTTVRLPGCRGL